MRKSLIAKAEAARKREHRTGRLDVRTAQAALELRVAARPRLIARSINPELTLDELQAKAAAAGRQMGRG
jgi:hypothetical protein